MAIRFSNNAQTTLASGITASATSITVANGSVFPTLTPGDHTYVTLEDLSGNLEIVKVTAISSNTLTVTRGQDGTTARAFSQGDFCQLRVTAALLNDLADESGYTLWTDIDNVPSPVITLSGDASGSATMTELGNATLNVTVANDSHTHDGRYYTESEADSRFLNVTGGDTLTGRLIFAESGYSIANDLHVWKRSYSVWLNNPKELLYHDGNSLPNGGAYRFHAHIAGTGTDQSATAVYWNQNGTWKVNVTYQSGVNSNHPEFIIGSNGKPHISIDHSSTYTIEVLGERLELGEGTGTDNKSGFGADAYMSEVLGALRHNPNGGSDYTSGDRVFTDGYHPNADAWTTSRTITLAGDLSGSVTLDGSSNVTLTGAVYNDSHIHTYSTLSFNAGTNAGTGFSASNFWISAHNTGQSDVPTTYVDIINLSSASTHGIQLASRYSSSSGDVWIRTRSDNNAAPNGPGLQPWNYLWHSNNDGSGSGLDADLLDGVQGSSFLRSDANDTATGLITFSNASDAQITLNGANTTWAGIKWQDVNGYDYTWYNGDNSTFSIGGGGSNVAGKKLHVHGGLSVGSGAASQATPTNGIYSQGEISVAGSTVYHTSNDGSLAKVVKGTVTGVNNSTYVTAFTVNGNSLASAVRCSFHGTSNAVVVNAVVDIQVNHSQDILISSSSGFYTKLTIKVVTNNNEDFAVEVKHNGNTSTDLSVEVFPLNSETVTFATSHSYTGNSLEHLCDFGLCFSGDGGSNANIKTDGSISAGAISASSVGVTNIVTNKVVKFNGTILDDSNITDTGSAITLGSNTTVSGTISSGAITTSGAFTMELGANSARQSTDYLYIGGDSLGSADGAIYIGNRGNGTGYGWRFYYHGTGGGNANDLSIQSENLGSPVNALRFNQDGTATFAGSVYFNDWVYMDTAGQNLVLRSDTNERETLEWQQGTTRTWTLTQLANGNLNFDPNGSYQLQVSGSRVVTDARIQAGTATYSTTGNVVSGRDSGGVALTINDSKGNANVTFNHANGVPEQNGNAARIEVNTDSTTGATMWFELKSGVTDGVGVDLTNIFHIDENGLDMDSGKGIKINGTEVISSSRDLTPANITATGTIGASGLATLSGGLSMSNTNIAFVNALSFADPGPGEGITWSGGNWSIWESPDDLTTNTGGNLQFVTSNSNRRMTVDTSGKLWTSHQGFVWGASNDGSGSGLDADMLDSYQYTQFNGVVARYRTTGTASGRIRITLPLATNSARMLKFTISQLSAYQQSTYEISGYLYPTSNNWYLPKCVYTGTTNPDIIVGRDANGYAYVSIANGNYTGIIVHSVTGGYQGADSDGYGSWTIAADNGTENSTTPEVHKVWTSRNDGSGSGLDADLLDGQHGSYYYPASNPNGYTANTGNVTEGGTSFSGEYPVVVRTSTNTIYSSAGIKFRGSDNRLTVDGNLVWHAGNDGSSSGLDADLLDGYHLSGATSVATKIFNNKGQNHSTYTDFNTVMTPGPNYIQAGNNGPHAGQFYGIMFGLGNDYGTSTGSSGHYASQMYYPRASQGGSPYLYFRDMESGTWGSWRKVYAGYADTAGNSDTVDGLHATSFLRSDVSDSVNGDLTVNAGMTFNSNLKRGAHNSGHLEGSYNNVGANGSKTNPIYTIGSNYNPTATALSDMYGIGFARRDQTSYLGSFTGNGWGMYVAASGAATIWLDAANGVIQSTGQHYAAGSVVWNAGNDGSGSGLDADTLDGYQASQFMHDEFMDNAYVDFTVGGDADTYYPVSIQGGGTFAYQTYSITRGYNWAAPSTWNTASHKGGLTLTWQYSGDGFWGGNDKDIRIIKFDETYSTMVMGMSGSVGGGGTHAGVVVWLRGGNATYRFYGPRGKQGSVNVHLTSVTASNGTVFSSRSFNASTRDGEINPKYPIRDSSLLYDNNSRVWSAASDGSGSGLDADLLDGVQASQFLRSDTSNALGGDLTITNRAILSAATSNWTGNPGANGKIQYHANRWYIVTDSNSNRIVQFRVDGADKSYIDNNGTLIGGGMWSSYNDGSGSGLDADTCDGQHLGTTSNPTFNTVRTPGANAEVKFSVWSGTTYGIGMQSGVTYGGLNDYAMTFCMNNDSDRGFWWGYSGQAKSAGAMSLTTGGILTVASSITAGGNITAYSDRRLKEDLRPITDALSKVQKLSGNTYTRNDQKDTETRYAGLIAQECAAVLPESVKEADGGVLALDYNAITALLLESIRELKAEVDDLKAQLEEVK